jgi:hypothetical protein
MGVATAKPISITLIATWNKVLWIGMISACFRVLIENGSRGGAHLPHRAGVLPQTQMAGAIFHLSAA